MVTGGAKYAEKQKQKMKNTYLLLKAMPWIYSPGFSFGGTPEQLKKLQSWVPLLYPYGVYEITNGGGGADIGP
jgi:hypothetical protein